MAMLRSLAEPSERMVARPATADIHLGIQLWFSRVKSTSPELYLGTYYRVGRLQAQFSASRASVVPCFPSVIFISISRSTRVILTGGG